jgi:hypothetical protein
MREASAGIFLTSVEKALRNQESGNHSVPVLQGFRNTYFCCCTSSHNWARPGRSHAHISSIPIFIIPRCQERYMIPLDVQDSEFQAMIRQELILSNDSVFTSCKIFEGSPVQDRCIGIVKDQNVTNILLRGLYEISGDAVILYLELPGAPDPRVVRQEIEKAGFQLDKTRLIGVCVRKEGTYAGGPEVLIIIIPY